MRATACPMHLFLGRRERLGRGNRAGLARGPLRGVMIRLMLIAIGAGRDTIRPIVRRGDAELGGSPSGGDPPDLVGTPIGEPECPVVANADGSRVAALRGEGELSDGGASPADEPRAPEGQPRHQPACGAAERATAQPPPLLPFDRSELFLRLYRGSLPRDLYHVPSTLLTFY
jgi:hypothetical protein